MSVIHTYKTWPSFFGAALSGDKTFEMRKDDRDPAPKVGDWLELREYEPGHERYTDRVVRVPITYVLRESEHCPAGYIVLGFENPAVNELRAKLAAASETIGHLEGNINNQAMRLAAALALTAPHLQEYTMRLESENKALEERIAGLAAALEFVEQNAMCDWSCEDGECLHPDIITKARAALKSSQPILDRARAEAKAEAFIEAGESDCEYDQVHSDWCFARAAALRDGREG